VRGGNGPKEPGNQNNEAGLYFFTLGIINVNQQREEEMKAKISLLTCFFFLVLSWAAYAQTIYVTDIGAPSISTWPETASGNITPTTTITGAATTMVFPLGVAVDANAIYVADCDNNSIDVFPINGDGNIAPSRSIQGAATTLNCPVGVAVDANWIYVTNYNHNSTDAFPINGSGNIAPSRSILGANTTLDGPGGMAIDASWIYVSDETNKVVVFPINGDGNIAPSRSIQGANTTFNSPYRLALDANWLYVSNRDNHSIVIFPKNGDGNIAPTRSIQGAATGLGSPWGIAVDSSWIYVVNYGATSPNLLVFPLSTSGDVLPDRIIQGSATGMQSPNNIAVSQNISPYEGTIGTEITISGFGFGTKKGKVLVGSASLKILEWTDVLISCQLTKALPPGTYDVRIRPQIKGSSPITIPNGFTAKTPEIDSVDPTSGSTGDEITINGLFFGTKKGKVTLGTKNCKGLSWTMVATTGVSEIRFVVPKGLSAGTYELIVTTTKVGSDTVNFTVE